MEWNTPQHNGLHDPDNDNAVSGMYTDLELAEDMLSEAYDAYRAAAADGDNDTAAVALSNARFWAAAVAKLRGVDISEVL